MISETIGIIGGAGWLGRSIAHSALRRGFISPARLILSGRTQSPALAGWPEVRIASSNQELADQADMVLLSVRPEQFPGVQMKASDKLVVSVMAGVPARAIAAQTGARRVVRAMPNAAAEIESSFTPWFAVAGATSADKSLVQRLFETCGVAEEVPTESDLDYLTGFSGMGPAFPALLAQAMLDHAIARGIEEGTARRAVEGVVIGAARLLAQPNRSAGEIIEALMSYRGVTAAALEAMTAGGFVKAVHAGLSSAEKAALRLSAPFGG